MTDEQREEIDILQSIYPDELDVVSDTEFSVLVCLETHPVRKLKVHVAFPENYPAEVIPVVDIEALPGEKASSEKPKETEVEYDFTREDLSDLTEKVRQCAEENLGIPSVFACVSYLKETAEELYQDKIKSIELERIRELEIAEEAEQAKFRGTPVTKESFSEWRNKFRHEMGWDIPKERPNGRLTGKEIFDKGIEEEAPEED